MAIVEVLVPQMGEGLQEVRVLRFLKQPGDTIARDEHIYEMETDKAVLEVESPYDGKLMEWLVSEGDILAIGAPIAKMESATAEVSAPAAHHAPAAPTSPAPSAPASPSAATPASGVLIPPRTRAHARSLGISEEELRTIPASSSKLLPEDVDKYVAAKQASAAQPAAAAVSDKYIDTPMSSQQRAFAYRVKRSSQLVVPGTIQCPVRWSAPQTVVNTLRAQNAEVQPSEFQVFAYSVAQAVKHHAKFRSTLLGEETIREYHHVNLGIAVARPGDELVTALVPEADSYDFFTFVRTAQSQIRKAREGQDQADASMQLLLTYMGAYGITGAVPVLVAPAVAVLFAGATYEQNGETWVNLALTFDHRLINGVGAAEFLKRIVETIESADKLILKP